MKFSNQRLALFFSLAFALCSVVFYSFPSLDLWLSGIFYDEAWWIHSYPYFYQLFKFTDEYVVFLGLAPFALIGLAPEKHISYNKLRYAIFYLVFSLSLHIFFNDLLKIIFGRVRPEYIFEFGGELAFSSAFEVVRICSHNCSFPSGHALAASAVLAFLWNYQGPKGFRFVLFVVAITTILSRVAQGRHFVSDVLTSYFLAHIYYFVLLYVAEKKHFLSIK